MFIEGTRVQLKDNLEFYIGGYEFVYPKGLPGVVEAVFEADETCAVLFDTHSYDIEVHMAELDII